MVDERRDFRGFCSSVIPPFAEASWGSTLATWPKAVSSRWKFVPNANDKAVGEGPRVGRDIRCVIRCHVPLYGIAHLTNFAGDMVYVEMFGKKFLMVNKYEVAFELLNKRSSIYSSRPNYVMVNELCVSVEVQYRV